MAISDKVYAKRRVTVFNKMKDCSILILPSNPTSIRSNDTDNKYKPNSDIMFLSGFPEPDATLILVKNGKTEFKLFVQPRDPEKETWTGRRYGPEGATKVFSAEEAFNNIELSIKLEEILKKINTIYYAFDVNKEQDKIILEAFSKARIGMQRSYFGPKEIIDAGELIHPMRLIKSPEEIDILKKGCEISADAHIKGMKAIRPGLYEYQMQAIVEQEFLLQGGLHPAYPSICAAGVNATILHYTDNSDQLKNGNLFLIDAATEYMGYCTDITRTYPVNGKFTDIQKQVYNIVLEAQLKAIELCKPGNKFQTVHEKAVETLTQGLITLGVLKGDLSQLIQEEKYKPFYMHRTSHWLGLETHDVGYYNIANGKSNNGTDQKAESVILEPGMVLTVEPGLYFQPRLEDIPNDLKGIGIRIEDDILITENGYVNLTAKVPKTIAEIEKLILSAH